jgi:lipoyl(octanoyl) transferase
VKELVFRIEQATIQTLEAVGIDGRRVKGAPGVYVPYAPSRAPAEFAGLAKIAALGIKIAKGCSYHGLALNVGMDLSPFSLINPCGYANLPAVDMATLDIHIDWNDAASRLAERLQTHLT